MRRMRWATDGGGAWELDAEAPVTMEGTARAVPGDPLPLGLSRGPRVTRPKQLDFFHRFMACPLVPSFAGDPLNGGPSLLLHHAHTRHLSNSWSATVLEQFNVQKFVSFIKENASSNLEETPWPKKIAKQMLDIFSLGFGTEFLITPDSSLLLETYNVKKGSRSKAVFHQKLPQHNLTLEAACPGLFVDKHGIYWDVPLSVAVDLASVSTGSGLSYHLCLQHNSGHPKHFGGDQSREVPESLQPGFCAKMALSIKNNIDIWRKKEDMLKMVQPYDIFLADPSVSGSGIFGAVFSAYLGENSARFLNKDESERCKAFSSYLQKNKLALFADTFASVSITAQRGNFQRLFLDLTRLNARVDFPSGSRFLNGAACLAYDLYSSQRPDSKTICAICPELLLSFQQQIIGPISFRVDSRIVFDSKDGRPVPVLDESVYALEWALKVLGSAKATTWYSPKRQEAMMELRFFQS